MARICEIVHHKLHWLFGEQKVRNEYEIIKRMVYAPLQINPSEGVSTSDIKRIVESITGLLPNSRIIAIEYEDQAGEMRTMAWEEYRDDYTHDWLNVALENEPERKYHLYCLID